MTNQDGWKKIAVLLAGQVLTAQVLNACFNKQFGTTGDHYPGDYAFVRDAKGALVPATNTQKMGGYDCIFVRTSESATYRVLPPEEHISNPRANKGRGRGANLLDDSTLDAKVEALLSGTAPKPPAQGKPKHNGNVSV